MSIFGPMNAIRLGLAALGLSLVSPALAKAPVLVENIGPKDRAILIRDNRIAYSGPRADVPLAEGAQVIDAEGAFAIPGLIDMHVHVWGHAELAAYLLHGVTTVRNLSGMPFHLRMAEAIESGALLGPRLYTSGPILNSLGPNQQINHQIEQTADEARAAVEAQHSAGFDRIKTYSNLTADAYAGALAAARKHGMRITGHTPEGERLAGIPSHRDFQISFAEVLGHGFETIEHAESIVFHGLRDRRDKQAGLALARRIADAGVPVTATLVAQRNLVRMAQTRGDFAKRDGTQWLNPVTQAMEAESIAFWSGQDPS